MPNLETRIEVLEKRFTSDADLPECILIIPESGRLNAEPDTSQIICLVSDNVTYDREPNETEESFIMRASELAKSKLPLPGAIPNLLVVTENMIAAGGWK